VEDFDKLDTNELTDTLLLLGLVLLWWWRVVTQGDSGYLDTTKLTASLLLEGPLPYVVVENSDAG
jgi:hypothetical protein